MNPFLEATRQRLKDSFPAAPTHEDRPAAPAGKAARRLVLVFRSGLLRLTGFTFVVNTLLLVQPVYMLQVYDRVLASGSLETLAFISLAAALALILLATMDAIRSMIASRLAAHMELEIGSDALIASINGPRAALGDVQPLRDLATVRGFVSNKTLLAYLDLPFAPVFIALLFFIHPHLFWLTLSGAAALTLLAVMNERMASGVSGETATVSAMMSAQAFAKSAETINAMGMTNHVVKAWGRDEASALDAQDRIAAVNAVFAGISRVMRLGLQITILGYGGYLVLQNEMTAGMIFASSLISGRGLQPIDQVIGGWKGLMETRKAWTRLKAALEPLPTQRTVTELPVPTGRITLDQLVVYPVATPSMPNPDPLLKRISAEIGAGECVAVIGASGSGKSTLARTLVGVLQPRSGSVCIDGTSIGNWDRTALGRHIGYLAQDADLLPGTVAQNIARFDADAADSAIVSAARRAQVHDLVMGLHRGYDTLIGPGGQQLSGGQRQRVGLARAFFGNPKVLVLDEPNANLDSDGDLALERALDLARQEGVTVFLVTQRRPIADKADKIMILSDGTLSQFGPRQEVFQRLIDRAQGLQAGANAPSNGFRPPASASMPSLATARL